jgi:hypothetical protein
MIIPACAGTNSLPEPEATISSASVPATNRLPPKGTSVTEKNIQALLRRNADAADKAAVAKAEKERQYDLLTTALTEFLTPIDINTNTGTVAMAAFRSDMQLASFLELYPTAKTHPLNSWVETFFPGKMIEVSDGNCNACVSTVRHVRIARFVDGALYYAELIGPKFIQENLALFADPPVLARWKRAFGDAIQTGFKIKDEIDIHYFQEGISYSQDLANRATVRVRWLFASGLFLDIGGTSARKADMLIEQSERLRVEQSRRDTLAAAAQRAAEERRQRAIVGQRAAEEDRQRKAACKRVYAGHVYWGGFSGLHKFVVLSVQPTMGTATVKEVRSGDVLEVDCRHVQ